MNEKNDPHQKKAKPDLTDDDFIIELTNEVEKKSDDNEIVFKLDNMDADFAADEANTKPDEVVFDLGEKIELTHDDDDEDKYDFFEIDDEETDEEKDRLSLLDNLDLEFGEEDDIISLDADREEKSASQVLESNASPKTSLTDDLPDLLAEMEFEFEEDEEEGVIAVDEHPAEASDNFIARAVEQSAASDEDADRIVFTEKSEESIDDSEAMALDDPQLEDDEILSPGQTELEDLKLSDDLLDFEDNINLKPEDDIIEITEFDQHFPEEDEKILEQAGVLDASGEEEDEFLELIDIGEDDSPEDEAGMAPKDFKMNKADAQISSFLNDKFEEDTEFKDDVTGPAEEPSTIGSEKAMEAEAFSSEGEEFDLNLDTQEISQHIDGLDVFLTDEASAEPEVEFLSEKKAEEIETEPAKASHFEDHPEEEESEHEVVALSEGHPEEEETEPLLASFAEDYPGEKEPELSVASVLEDHLEEEETEPVVPSFSEDHLEEAEPEPVVTSFSEDHIEKEVFEPAVASLTEVQPEEEESEPEVIPLSEDPPAKVEALQEDVPAIQEPGESVAVTPELVSAAIERVIKEKFSGQIESIIYEVIEKAVTNEINHLKAVLLEGGSLDDEL